MARTVLRGDGVDQTARTEFYEACADRRIEIEKFREIAPGNSDGAHRGQRARGTRADRRARIEAGVQKLHLAEHIAPDHAGKPGGAAGGIRGEPHLDKRLGGALARIFRADKKEKAVSRLAGFEDRRARRIGLCTKPQTAEPPSDIRIA